MGMFSFLNTLTLEPTAVAAARITATGTIKNPTTADLRVFRNGAIFPSQKLVDASDLTYRHKSSEEAGNAFDIIDSREWPQYPQNAPEHAVFIALVPRKSPKTDLFSYTKFNEDGTPYSDVMTQGTAGYGKELLALLSQVYNVPIETMFAGQPYVDLVITQDALPASNNGLYYFPKAITKGEDKGKSECVRRENSNPFVLVFKGISEEYPREDGTFGALAGELAVVEQLEANEGNGEYDNLPNLFDDEEEEEEVARVLPSLSFQGLPANKL